MTSHAMLRSYLARGDHHRQTRALIDRLCGQEGMQEVLAAEAARNRAPGPAEGDGPGPALHQRFGLAHAMVDLSRLAARRESE